MNGKAILATCATVFFLAVYLAISYIFLVNGVADSKKYMVTQTRISLREISDRLAMFLEEQAKALKMIGMISKMREEVSRSDSGFLKSVSSLKLSEGTLMLALDEAGDCVMVTPAKYKPLFMDRKPEEKIIFRSAKERRTCFITPVLPLREEPGKPEQFFIFACTPIASPDGSLEGVIALGFTVEKLFNDNLKPLEFDGNMACITDLEGNVEISGDPAALKRNACEAGSLPPISKAIKALGYHGHSEWKAPDGKDYLIVYHPVTVDGRLLIAQLRIPCAALSQFLLPFYIKHSVLLLIMALAALGGIFIAVATSRQIRQLKSRINALEFEIDHERKKAAVEEIASSEYFQCLQQEARRLKE